MRVTDIRHRGGYRLFGPALDRANATDACLPGCEYFWGWSYYGNVACVVRFGGQALAVSFFFCFGQLFSVVMCVCFVKSEKLEEEDWLREVKEAFFTPFFFPFLFLCVFFL